jgi:predicted acetyltransferase
VKKSINNFFKLNFQIDPDFRPIKNTSHKMLENISFVEEKSGFTKEKLEIINIFASSLVEKFDCFFEDVILFNPENKFFYVKNGDEKIGYFIFKDECIYHFFIFKEICSSFPRIQKLIFEKILKDFRIVKCFTYALDSSFLNLILEKQKRITVEGCAPFVYQYQNNFREKKYFGNDNRFEEFQLNLIENNVNNEKYIQEIIKDEKNFLTKEEVFPMLEKGNLYFFRNQESIIGIGVKQNSLVYENVSSIGMLIKQEFRQKGLGSLLLLKLQHLCLMEGKISNSGCAYENVLSRKTIEKSSGELRGFVLNVDF